MSKDKISDYSATANSNTDIGGINIDEGCAPSGINDAIRTLMKQLKDFQQGTNSDPFNGPHNGTVGATTPASGAFTTLSASSTLSVTGAGTIQGLTVGRGAGAVSTNTAVGASALAANTTGANNFAAGYQALQANTTANQNTAVGSQAAYSNTTGSSLEAFGYQALYSNTTGNYNSAFGFYALQQNTTGSRNSAFSRGALAANTTGSNNVSMGVSSLNANTTGSYNTAIGDSALGNNTTSGYNTAVGYQAGVNYNNTSGNGGNSLFGVLAGSALTTGFQNTLIGAVAGGGLTTGSYNTIVGGQSSTGYGAGQLITTGSRNTVLGGFSGNQGGLDIRTASNRIVLSDGDGNPAWSFDGGSGWSIRGDTTNNTGNIKFRNSSFTKYWEIASNDGTWFFADDNFSHYAYLLQNMTSWGFGSDRRMKKDIVDLDYGLDAVMAMRPKRYTFIASGKEDIGFIAQELKEIVPEAVSGEEIEYLETDTPQERASKSLGIGKELLIPVLVKAIQELKAEFDAYKEAHP